MTPKEKAIELVDKYDELLTYLESKSKAKIIALLSVDLLIANTPSVDIYPYNFQEITPRVKEYWKEVKQEIEKL